MEKPEKAKGFAIPRHYPGMKAALCLPLIFAACAWADEAADRAAITRAIDTLNQQPQSLAEITDSQTAANELEMSAVGAMWVHGPASPSVTISHEPWGEAQMDWPGLQLRRVRMVAGAMRFITPEVALVDGYWARDDGARRPILLVMRKVGDAWKIASVRTLAAR